MDTPGPPDLPLSDEYHKNLKSSFLYEITLHPCGESGDMKLPPPLRCHSNSRISLSDEKSTTNVFHPLLYN